MQTLYDARMPAHQTGTLLSGDITLHYRRFGKPGKTPLAMLHGVSFFSYDWIEVAAALAADREVVAMDLRGFGDSSWSAAKDYSVPSNAKDILALADHLGWRKFFLFGHSMSGRHCTWCAAGNPERIAGLVLGDFSPDNAPAGSQRVAQTVANTPEVFPSVDEAMRYFKINPASPAGRTRRARFEAYLKPVAGGFTVKRDTLFRDQFRRTLESGKRAPLGVDLWDALKRLRVPAKMIRGARSDLFAAETVAKVKAANPGIAIVEIDAGHNLALDNPEAVIRETRAFLDAL
jgi:pimeloyl-ACP methyl ester carboxylesterase